MELQIYISLPYTFPDMFQSISNIQIYVLHEIGFAKWLSTNDIKQEKSIRFSLWAVLPKLSSKIFFSYFVILRKDWETKTNQAQTFSLNCLTLYGACSSDPFRHLWPPTHNVPKHYTFRYAQQHKFVQRQCEMLGVRRVVAWACVRVSLHVSSYLACNTELMSRNITQGDEEIICTNLYVHYYICYQPY